MSEAEYREKMARINAILAETPDPEPQSEAGRELDRLVDEVIGYEAEHYSLIE